MQFCAWQAADAPRLESVCMRLFAADHGIAAEGVSAYPQAVTAQMVAALSSGRAAARILARQMAADYRVINLGTMTPVAVRAACLHQPLLARQSRNMAREAALGDELLAACLEQGRAHAPPSGQHLFIGGDMGIGNSTAAAALCCALMDAPPRRMVGGGSGADDRIMELKRSLVRRALRRHRPSINKAGSAAERARRALATLGGMELAALAGAFIAGARNGVPALVDGFIASAAALAACSLNRTLRPWLLFAHRSAERGHGPLLRALDARPLLDLGMRLGEGSGAALAVPLLQSACTLHSRMQTFAEAGVDGGQP